MNVKTGRRQFLRSAMQVAGAAATIPALGGLRILDANGRVQAAQGHGGYGPLIPTRDLRDGVERIALPKGFKYRTFSPAGATMSDGKRVPLAHDGMGLFYMSDGRLRLIRNHEDRSAPGAGTTALDQNAYDSRGGGGTTTLVFNPFTRTLERDFISLNGTIVNCAGGVTPWGSWITCEETNAGPATWQKQHGYCFEVPASANGTVPAVPIPAMGRFSHEALAVDPTTGIVYETEDNSGSFQGTSGTSGFYRYIPRRFGRLAMAGGRLQMLAIKDLFQCDLRRGLEVGQPLPVVWVEIDNPNPAGTSPTAVFSQGWNKGAARFRRLEGCWWGNNAVYFCDTNGGNAGFGTVWEFQPDGDGGTLTLIFESAGQHELDFPDNLTVSPQGSILLCEDGGGDQYMRGVTLDGHIFDFARNLQNDYEWAGAVFADPPLSWNNIRIRRNNPPLGGNWDRITLFVNRQGATDGANPPAAGNEGLTFAIWGDWGAGAL